jgi:hypothetical protein
MRLAVPLGHVREHLELLGVWRVETVTSCVVDAASGARRLQAAAIVGNRRGAQGRQLVTAVFTRRRP